MEQEISFNYVLFESIDFAFSLTPGMFIFFMGRPGISSLFFLNYLAPVYMI